MRWSGTRARAAYAHIETPRLAREFRSTATLVVCAVSLVGQWIDEARSKLDGAGGLRIHMYHGQKRIKDAARLANDFDLVVTTYQTIASDRGKFGLNHPTARIEWYRVVLDEAHMAKSATTAQSWACHELRAARMLQGALAARVREPPGGGGRGRPVRRCG